MSSTPVGFLYTPQQLMGSAKYGAGVLLGNWREEDALEEMRLMDFISAKQSGDSELLNNKRMLQEAPVALSHVAADGLIRSGDVFVLRSHANGGCLAVSVGEPLVSETLQSKVFAGVSAQGMARNALKITGFEESLEGSPLKYGQKVLLNFTAVGFRGVLASCRKARTQFSTQVTNMQEAYMQVLDANTRAPYDCAWHILPAAVDDRLPSQGAVIPAAESFVLVHCFTGLKLAGLNFTLLNDFGSEFAVSVHTFTAAAKVSKLSRERAGMPVNDLVTQTENVENLWSAVYAA